MPKGSKFWTYDHEQTLRRWHGEGMTLSAIVSKFDGRVSYDSVSERARKLGLVFAGGLRPRFWNPERDLRLCELWQQEKPVLSLREISDAFGGEVQPSTISYRAGQLKLPRRYGRPRGKAAPEHSKNATFRSPFPGENPSRGAETPKLRIVPFVRFQPCPFYHPMEGGACTETVDRKPRADGTLPSQYCAKHQHRIYPIPKGSLGFIRRHTHGVAGLGRVG